MVTLTEGNYFGDVILYHVPAYSIDEETLLAGQNYKVGSVLGRITASNKLTLHAPGANDGSENIVAVLARETDATDGDRQAPVVARHARVNRSALVFDPSIDTSGERQTAVTALAAIGILSDQ